MKLLTGKELKKKITFIKADLITLLGIEDGIDIGELIERKARRRSEEK